MACSGTAFDLYIYIYIYIYIYTFFFFCRSAAEVLDILPVRSIVWAEKHLILESSCIYNPFS
jgi:hypothetical protein